MHGTGSVKRQPHKMVLALKRLNFHKSSAIRLSDFKAFITKLLFVFSATQRRQKRLLVFALKASGLKLIFSKRLDGRRDDQL